MSAVPTPIRTHVPKTHLAGEFFVAAELAKRGYEVSVTMGNAKSIDLFAERDGGTVLVQVKAIAHRRHNGWPLPTDPARIRDGTVWVCVVLNEVGEAPSYFVTVPAEVRRLGRFYDTRAVLDITALRAAGRQDAWDMLDAALAREAGA